MSTEQEPSITDLESEPRFECGIFSREDAYDLGTIAADLIRARGLDLAVDIVLGTELVYRARFGATSVVNDTWLEGKAATVRRYREPSLLVRLRAEARGETPDQSGEDDGIRVSGGSIPIFTGAELVGTITMSGEADFIDHRTAMVAINLYSSDL